MSAVVLSFAASLGNGLLIVPAQAAPASTRTVYNQGSSRSSVRNAATSAYTAAVLNSVPLAFYRLNDSGTTLVDSSGNGLDGLYGSGVAQNAPTMTSTGDAASFFSGTSFNPNNFATTAPNSQLQPTFVSVEAWVRISEFNAFNTYLPIVSYGRYSEGPAYIVSASAQNAVNLFVKTSRGKVNVQGRTTLLAGQAYHIVCTYDGNAVSVYVNGKLENSKLIAGALDYTDIHPTDGLGIGGAESGLQPVFPGAISEVAIYGRALSAAEIQSHYVTGVKPTLINEVPQQADSLVEMEGINTHLHYTNSVYVSAYPTIKTLLVELGVRHLRDGLDDTTWQPYYDHLNELGRLGIKTTFMTDRAQTSALFLAYPRRVPDAFEAFEGPNEQDLNFASDPQWVQKAQAFQKLLYTTVRGNIATNKYPVLGPSITGLTATQQVGDLSAYMDAGSSHQYFSAFNPGTAGWGSHSALGIYGSIAWNLNVAKILDGSKPVQVTETGYSTGAGITGNVPADIEEKYVTRTFLELFNNGVKRASIYQLVDVNGNFGLINANLSPKPAYYALMNMNALLSDKGPAFTPTPLSFLLAGNMSNVHHVLLQKRDGSYYLALWIEAPSWQPVTGPGGGGAYISVQSQNVNLTLPATPRGLSLTSWNSSGATSTSSIPLTQNVTVPITDSLSVVHIVP